MTIFCEILSQDDVANLQKWRSNNEFEKLYDSANVKFDQMLSMVNDVRTLRSGNLDQEVLKEMYYEILNVCISQIKTRFSDFQKLRFLSLLDFSRYDTFSDHFPAELFQLFIESQYAKFFDFQRLRNELCVMYAQRDVSVNSIVHTIKEFVEKDLTTCFPESFKLVCLVATLPVTTACVERSFSVLKRIKSYLRNSIGQKRLNSSSKISIESAKLHRLKKDEQFYDDTIDMFSGMKKRKVEFLYK